MLLSNSTRCIRRIPPSHPSRLFTTRPRRLPVFVESWNPSTHNAVSPATPSSESEKLNAQEEAARQRGRARLRNIGNEAIVLEKGNIETTAPRIHWHDARRRFAIMAFNDLLRADVPLTEKHRYWLWASYQRLKALAPDALPTVPGRIWDALWEVEFRKMKAGRTKVARRIRQKHLDELSRDMKVAGTSLTVHQRAQYLEGLFSSGQEDQALEEWEKDRADTHKRQDYKAEHLVTGARMYAYANHVDRARGIMDELFSLYPSWDPSIILPVFRAHTRSTSEEHRSSAVDIYQRRRSHEQKLSTEDYDGFLVGFIEAHDLQHAKMVFGHMVETGHLASDYSQHQINEVLRRLHHIYRLGTDIAKMTSIALHAISILPKSYHFHLFGDWMRSAVIRKAPEAAAQILEMMLQRGYAPQTFHFNHLLRALLRSNEQRHDLKAENIGWQMIEQCDKAAPHNNRRAHAADAISKRRSHPTTGKGCLSREVPAANADTFALLMERHARLSQWEHVEYLARRLKTLGLRPNVSVMNAMMRSASAMGNYDKVWDIYQTLTHVQDGSRGVFPDGMSFRILWGTLRLALGSKASSKNKAHPSPRSLLADNVRWWGMVRSRSDVERFRIGTAADDLGALETLVMHCFSYTKDLPGSLVAVHASRIYFDLFPSAKSARILQENVAWTDLQGETDSVRGQYWHSGSHKHKLEQMDRVYQFLRKSRFERMRITEDDFTQMDEEEAGDLTINLLSEFVRVILKRQHSPESVEAMIDEAKKEVGVLHMVTGDMDAFEVV